MSCRFPLACAALPALLSLVACTGSSSKTAATDAGVRDGALDAPTLNDVAVDAPMEGAIAYPAPHPAAPRVLNAGGPVMTAPRFVIITFAGDALQASIDDFAAKVAAAKDYWSGTTAEYGVGPVSSVVDIAVADTPSATLDDSQIQAWLAAKIAGSAAPADAGFAPGDAGDPAFPQPDINTVYMMFYPATVTVTMGGGSSCSSFEGYHSDFALAPGKFVTYSVVGRCPPMGPVMPIDQLTAVASHELIEAATDPLVQDDPAWSSVDADHVAWDFVGGGEIGDMCAGYPDAFYTPKDLPYLVQKVWSNAAAAASHDPCEPDGASPYFNAAPELTSSLTINDPTVGTFTTKGIRIPIGTTGVVQLDLFSDAPTSGPIMVTAFDVASAFLQEPAELSFSFDKTSGVNGDSIQMTVKSLAAGTGGASVFWIQTQVGSNQAVQNVWVGLVGN